MRADLSAEYVRDVLHYEPTTGAFTWARKRRHVRVGAIAGHCDPRGYRYISINDHPYAAHRLAYVYVTGAWPVGVVDHMNGDKSDNRWGNLRAVTHVENAQNVRKPTQRNQLGLLGVSPAPRCGFKATIQVRGHSIHLGYHKTPELAHAAYVAAKRELHGGNTL